MFKLHSIFTGGDGGWSFILKYLYNFIHFSFYCICLVGVASCTPSIPSVYETQVTCRDNSTTMVPQDTNQFVVYARRLYRVRFKCSRLPSVRDVDGRNNTDTVMIAFKDVSCNTPIYPNNTYYAIHKTEAAKSMGCQKDKNTAGFWFPVHDKRHQNIPYRQYRRERLPKVTFCNTDKI